MDRNQKSMLIEMSKKDLIVGALKAIQDNVEKIHITMEPEEADETFGAIDNSVSDLEKRINQLKSLFNRTNSN